MLTDFKLFESFKSAYPLYGIIYNENNDLFFILNNTRSLNIIRFAELDFDNNIIDDELSYTNNIPQANVDAFYLFERYEDISPREFVKKYYMLIELLIKRNLASEFLEKPEIKKYLKSNSFNL